QRRGVADEPPTPGCRTGAAAVQLCAYAKTAREWRDPAAIPREGNREEDRMRELRAMLVGGLVVAALTLGATRPVAAAPSDQGMFSWPGTVMLCILIGAPDIGACIQAAGPSTSPHP